MGFLDRLRRPTAGKLRETDARAALYTSELAELEARPDAGPTCSECGKTSKELMVTFKRQRLDAAIIDKSWVGTCPECGEAYCKSHSTKVPDETWGDPVPACPVHEKQLRFSAD